ncbi:MAG: Rrf2 family transcriptional regulator [Oscillospiraceae bacterium]
MRTNTQFTVSVQLLILVALSGEKRVTSDMIAESTGCNPVMVRQLFTKLKEAGLLRISVGRGTTALARDPGDITLWDVFAAVEGGGRDSLFSFHPGISRSCKVGRSFEEVLGGHLDDAAAAMRESLAGVTLRQLVQETAAAAGA